MHLDPSKANNYPMNDINLYGLSVSNNFNAWTIIAGNYTRSNARKIMEKDCVEVILDCDNSTIRYQHSKWTEEIKELPREELFFYFYPYDLDFKIEF